MTGRLTLTQFVCILAYAAMSRMRVFGLRRCRWAFTRRSA